MAFPLWPSAVNPNLIPPKYFTTWQAPLPTIGATQVTTGAELDAAVDAAVDGETIEMTVVGAYMLTNQLDLRGNRAVTINAMVEGAYIDGPNRVFHQDSTTDWTVTGVEFRNGLSGMQVYTKEGALTLNRCLFKPTVHRQIYSIFQNNGGTLSTNGCIFDNASTTASVYMEWTSSAMVTLKNCIIDNGTSGGLCIRQQGGTMNAHNCGLRSTGATCQGTIGGDYNAATDATAPGANSHDNITWANEFDASYLPLTAMGKVGGDPANAAALDYLGNIITTVAPVGAILAA